MSTLAVDGTQSGGSVLGSSLQAMLLADDIVPGSEPSYSLCKQIYLLHPLGQKMAESPIKMAQFLDRKISIAEGPEKELVKAFKRQWMDDQANSNILSLGAQARVYGIASMAVLTEGQEPSTPLDLKDVAKKPIAFNILDPLNTAGSLVFNQNPNAFDFQKHVGIAVNGIAYHRSRSVTLMNENPIYIAFTSSSFGFVGRSCYQRALFPLKSFIQTMVADDMVSRKVGLIIAKLKQPGSVIDNVMKWASQVKASILKLGATNNILTIGTDESIESVDLTNVDGPLTVSRKNILENIAAAADMPAKLLNNETFAEGFGEGTEDARAVAKYVEGIRVWLHPAYKFMDAIIQRRAWNEEFFKVCQKNDPETYGKMDYETAFYSWVNSFEAAWPPLIQEPESEKVRVADTKLKGAIAIMQVVLPELDPENKAQLFEWFEDTLNEMKEWFPTPLMLDYQALVEQMKKTQDATDKMAEQAPSAAPPFSARDSAGLARWLMAPTDGNDLVRRIESIERILKPRLEVAKA